ncbi:MAG: response regulator [Mucilaginibacter sp.]
MDEANGKIRIILAEDHNIVRNGIRNLLDRDNELKVVAEAVDGRAALDLIKNGVKADILLADMNMPQMDGVQLTEQLQHIPHKPKVVLLTMLDREQNVIRAFKAGAHGYLLKSVAADELIFAVKHVRENGKYISSELSLRFLDRIGYLPNINQVIQESDMELSQKDLQILELIANGLTNQEIADSLFTSKRTIEGYRQSLIDKTGTRNTASLVRYAVRHKLIN